MELKREDRRIKRTKQKLREALADLIEEKGFDAIKIHDLTEKADINRGTFYLHYKDKYDLLEQNENEIIEEILKIHEEAKKHKKESPSNTQALIMTPDPAFIKLFEYIQQNEKFMKVLFGKNSNPSFQEKLKKLLRENMLKSFISRQLEKKMLIPIEYFLAFVVTAHIGIIQQWVENGMKESPATMSLIITRIAFNQMMCNEKSKEN